MSDTQIATLVRGYTITSAYEYLRRSVGAESPALGRLPPDTQQIAMSAKPADWSPGIHLSRLHATVAHEMGQGDEKKTRDALMNCGVFSASEAVGTFLRLLMRVLTPELFAKKMPDLFSRDFKKGTMSSTVDNGRFIGRVEGIDPFEHLAPVSAGYCMFALKAMGKTPELVALEGWSLAKPTSSSFQFVCTWT